MNERTSIAGRFAKSAVAMAAVGLFVSQAAALGLGRMVVQSALGETMRAEIDITSLTPEEAATLRLRVAPMDSYKAAGVEYNPVLSATQVSLQRRGDGRPYLRLSSDRAVQEPFIDIILELNWANGRLVREYTLLFDPPSSRPAAAAAPAAAPVISAPPAPAPVQAAAPVVAAPSPAPTAAPSPAPSPATVPAASPAPVAAPAPTRPAPAPAPKQASAAPSAKPAEATEVRVRSGDTLTGLAKRNLSKGVSLDQMLVALHRANPDAFVDGNMNRLRSGSVLSVPTAETAKGTSTDQAREVIRAQTADFEAYKQRLAGGVAPARAQEAGRQAAGQVTAKVEEKKPAPAASTDKLKLAQGAVKAGAAPEAKIAKEAEKKDSGNRLAELSRNVEELRKLQTAASAPAAKPGAAPAPAPAAPATPAANPAPSPAPAAATPAQKPAAPVTNTPASAVAPTSPSMTAALPASASPKAPAASPAAGKGPTQAAVAASSAAPKASAPKLPPAPAPAAEESTSLLDSPWVLPGAGVLAALLAAFGAYRLRGRLRKASSETSFLESRLQPDSFFGASGGQRIDTRDVPGNTSSSASSSASSMSYSLSQLDAIGDVDPVAEADVYLAYGRDLQAEEILKEAMRATPERMAVRTKLLEVYAKRRDTKGFEVLATQLYALTQGDGDDWQKAQELGRQIDPDNPLYQPGGQPVPRDGEPDLPIEPLGASTMPQSVMPAPALEAPAQHGNVGDLDLDLDLDIEPESVPSMRTQPMPALSEVTQTLGSGDDRIEPALMPSSASLDDLGSLGDEPQLPALDDVPVAQAPMAETLDLDLGGISLDLDEAPAPAAAAEPVSTAYDSRLSELPDLPSQMPDEGGDPLIRKLELAEEFRQIGDMEGARDLLEEVVAKAEGGLKAKAQGMLEDLG